MPKITCDCGRPLPRPVPRECPYCGAILVGTRRRHTWGPWITWLVILAAFALLAGFGIIWAGRQ